ncbi:MAG: hypothetical protein RL745_607 [Actinomycetota bacterium]|jgi:MFS family permease
MSILGDNIAYVCLVWRLKDHGTVAVMALTVVNAAVMVAAAPWAGLLADRVSAKKLVASVTAAQAVVAAGLAWTGSGPLTIVGIGLLALGTAMVNPAWQALLPRLVDEAQLPRTMGLSQSLTSIGATAGPVVGGVLVAGFGTRTPMLLDAASFLVYAGLALALRKDRVPSPTPKATSRTREITAGLAVLRSDSVMRTLLGVLVFSVLGFGALGVVEVFFITEQLKADASVYGLLSLVYGLGNLAGALLMPRFTIPKRLLGVTAIAAEVVIAIGILGFGLSRSIPVAAATLLFAGLGNGVINMVFGLLFAYRVPDEVRGRFGAAFGSIITTSSMTSMLLAGLLGTTLSAATIIMLGGALAMAAGVIGLPVLLRAQARDPLAAQIAEPSRSSETTSADDEHSTSVTTPEPRAGDESETATTPRT